MNEEYRPGDVRRDYEPGEGPGRAMAVAFAIMAALAAIAAIVWLVAS